MKLGDSITYSAVLRRTWVGPRDIATWLPRAIAPTRGVIVGTRTLAIGRTRQDGEFDEWSGRSYTIRVWERLGSVRAVLVAYDMVRAPVYVPLDAVWYCPPEIVERLMRPRLTSGETNAPS